MAGFWLKSHDTHSSSDGIHANKPLVNQWHGAVLGQSSLGTGHPSPGARDVTALGSRMSHPWSQGCSRKPQCQPWTQDTPLMGGALCDGDPKSRHQTRAGGAVLLALTLTPALLASPGSSPECHLVSPHVRHLPPRDQGKRHDGANQTKPPPVITTHLFHQPSPNFNIISRQPANQRQLPRIAVNGSLFSRLLLNRYRN